MVPQGAEPPSQMTRTRYDVRDRTAVADGRADLDFDVGAEQIRPNFPARGI
jgi:hypothetical protein